MSTQHHIVMLCQSGRVLVIALSEISPVENWLLIARHNTTIPVVPSAATWWINRGLYVYLWCCCNYWNLCLLPTVNVYTITMMYVWGACRCSSYGHLNSFFIRHLCSRIEIWVMVALLMKNCATHHVHVWHVLLFLNSLNSYYIHRNPQTTRFEWNVSCQRWVYVH